MNGAASATPWGPLITVRPGAGESGRTVLLSDALGRRRARVDAAALLDLIASEYRRITPPPAAKKLADRLRDLGWRPGQRVAGETIDRLRRWLDRGWHPSLQYFLWSRGRPYVDAADRTGNIRRTVIDGYLMEGPPVASDPEGTEVPLPTAADLPSDATLGRLLMTRRSLRAYAPVEVPSTVLSSVLFHGLGDVRANQVRLPHDLLDYLKSHGVAFDFHLVIYRVDGLDAGVYRYDVARHRLFQIRAGDFREEMVSVLVGMSSPRTAGWTLFLTVDFPRYQWRYRHERALRHLYMASGRLGQRVLLVGQAFGLGTLPTPAMRDGDCCQLLQIDPRRYAPIYTLTMGLFPTESTQVWRS
jgi:SagB-type dehydrogenase family enzyme